MTVRLKVLLAGPNHPLGLPAEWPVDVEELAPTDLQVITEPYVEMNPTQYERWRELRQTSYDEWELVREIEIAKYGADGKGGMSDQLWRACYDYNFQFFSGGAYAQILELKFAGVSSALAAQNWILQLWTDYYTRKYFMSVATTLEAVAATNLDFSNNGTPPFTVPQMLAEAAALGIGQ